MKVIQDITKKNAKKKHWSHFKHVLVFCLRHLHHTNWKSSFYGSWQKLSKLVQTLRLWKIVDHIGLWKLISTYWTKSHPQIIPGKSWLSVVCVLAAAGARGLCWAHPTCQALPWEAAWSWEQSGVYLMKWWPPPHWLWSSMAGEVVVIARCGRKEINLFEVSAVTGAGVAGGRGGVRGKDAVTGAEAGMGGGWFSELTMNSNENREKD